MKPEWDAYHIAITKTHIKSEEGYKLEAYKCTEGYLTGGYGHRIMDGEAIPSTKKGWVEIFEKDYSKAENGAQELLMLSENLHPNAFGIVIEMCYQMGSFGVSKFKKFLSALNQEQPDYVEASKEMLDSKWAKQTPNRANRMSERMAEIATKIFG